MGFGTMYGNNMVKLIEMKFRFWDNVQKYIVKKLLETKLGFWYNVRNYNNKNTFRDNAWVLGQCT